MLYFVIVVLVFFVLTYLLFRLFIKLYFKSKVARYSLNSNFPTRIALLVLYGAFCVMNPTFSELFVNWAIESLNDKNGWELSPVELEINIWTIVLFAILVFGVGFIIYQSYRSRILIFQEDEANKKREEEKKEIKFPLETWSESPHFHERIKNYFELKSKQNNLKLRHSNKDRVLYGTYVDGLRTYAVFISYNDSKADERIEHSVISDKYNLLRTFKTDFFKQLNPPTAILEEYHVCFSNGTIDYETNEFLIWTEDKLVNSLINFENYLNRIVTTFESEKLFSAIAKESDKKSLAQTYIASDFSLNQKDTDSTLQEYINNWLLDSAVTKHLVLLGDYGMGKTSFLKYFRYSLAKSILGGNSISRFPVYLPLTNYSPRHGGIDQRVKAFVAENLGVDFQLFELLINKGKVLFLLDGFDEMGFVGNHDDRFKQMNEIWQLATKNNKLILAGRPSYFPREFEMEQALNIVSEDQEIVQTRPYCESLKLKELTDNQIKEYIAKYYPDKVESYFYWLGQNSSMMDLCRRPSIMHIIREMLPKLIKGKTDAIYTQGGAINMYLDYWINRQEGKQIPSSFPLSSEKRLFIKGFFRKLAVKLFLSDQRDLNLDYIKSTLQEVLEQHEKILFTDKMALEGFEHELFTGYFIEPKDGSYRFVHQSFFDFFVSLEIIEKLRYKKYGDQILYKDWSNSIVNFIYDHIDVNLKINTKVPALLLLRSSPMVAILKARIFRFLYTYNEGIEALYILTTLTALSFYYFNILKMKWYWEILIYLPMVIVMAIAIVLIAEMFGKLKKSRKVRFIEKAFKIAFIKNQLSIDSDLDFVMKLSGSEFEPHIPLENITFDSLTFKKDSFYNLKEVFFMNCTMSLDQISNCHFHDVIFNNTKFNRILFQNCTFTNVQFQDCYFSGSSVTPSENVKNKISGKSDNIHVFFEDCRFDDKSISNILQLSEESYLDIGTEISGTDDFLNKIRLVSYRQRS